MEVRCPVFRLSVVAPRTEAHLVDFAVHYHVLPPLSARPGCEVPEVVVVAPRDLAAAVALALVPSRRPGVAWYLDPPDVVTKVRLEACSLPR